MVDVAQLVEHQIVALGVVGSNPAIHPKEVKMLQSRKKALKWWHII